MPADPAQLMAVLGMGEPDEVQRLLQMIQMQNQPQQPGPFTQQPTGLSGRLMQPTPQRLQPRGAFAPPPLG